MRPLTYNPEHLPKNVSIHASVKDATRTVSYSFDFRYDVSIHASVKDATSFVATFQKSDIVSIHASVKDATDLEVASFNKQNVSIHASVKDATKSCGIKITVCCFNPRICKRCDYILMYIFLTFWFQSTHL